MTTIEPSVPADGQVWVTPLGARRQVAGAPALDSRGGRPRPKLPVRSITSEWHTGDDPGPVWWADLETVVTFWRPEAP